MPRTSFGRGSTGPAAEQPARRRRALARAPASATAETSHPRSTSTAPVDADHPVTRYARDIVEWRVVAGHLVRLAAERHLRDLEELPGYRFSARHADHVLNFFPTYLR